MALSGTLTSGHRILWRYTVKSSNTNTTDATLYYGGAVSGTLRDSKSDFCVTAPANPTLDTQVDKLVASAGNTLTYTIRFANAGQTSMTSAQIANSLPAGVTFTSATLNGAAASAVTTAGQTHVQRQLVRHRDQRTSERRAVRPPRRQRDDLVAVHRRLQHADRFGDLTSAVPSPLTDTITTVLQRPSVTITKSSDRTLLVPGDTVTYTVNAINAGPGSATDVTIGDTLPASAYFTYVANSARLNGTTISPDPVAGNILSKNIGTLAAGASASVTFQMLVASSGAPSGTTSISNTATVADAATSGTRSSNASTLTISTNPNLALAKVSSPHPVRSPPAPRLPTR